MFFDSRIWLTCKRILSNFKQIKQFYKNKKNTKVIYFEVPTDVGLNNVYVVVIKAVDSSSNIGYETVTVTVTDVVDTSSKCCFVQQVKIFFIAYY